MKTNDKTRVSTEFAFTVSLLQIVLNNAAVIETVEPRVSANFWEQFKRICLFLVSVPTLGCSAFDQVNTRNRRILTVWFC